VLKLDSQVAKKLIKNSVITSSTLSETFHENTKLSPLSGRAYYEHILKITESPVVHNVISHPYKVYSLSEQMLLPAVDSENDVERAIMRRRSARKFTGEPLTLPEISKLLKFAYGITDYKNELRAVASGGALYPLEIYLVPLRIEGIKPGIYHYSVEQHALDLIEERDCWTQFKEAIALQYVDVETASALFVITAMFERTTLKYLDRGYRLILIEAGEVAQNLALMAPVLGLGACLLGSFLDDRLSGLLGIDGIDESPVLPIIVGRATEAMERRL
jgi:SagB-type dehydrogenase family enzyme